MPIKAKHKNPEKLVFAVSTPVNIKAAENDDKGEAKGPPTFDVTAYTGGALMLMGWEYPVVIDLAGLGFSRSIVANLDHVDSQRVGHVTGKEKSESELNLSGVFSAATDYRDEVVNSAKDGFQWEASVEVQPNKVVEVEAGKSIKVNGQEFNGPLYVTKKGTLVGFAFVSHGADENTSVSIAAAAASTKENEMDEKLKAFIEAMLPGVDVNTLSAEAVANLTADFEGKEGKRKIAASKSSASDGLESKKLEAERCAEINRLATEWCDEALKLERYEDIQSIREARDNAIKGGTSVKDFRYELKLATLQQGPPVISSPRQRNLTSKVLEAAACIAGKLKDVEEEFDDQTLQMAHDRFKGRVSLNELLIIGAEANGYCGRIGSRVDTELHNAAFGLGDYKPMRAGGFSTISLPNVFSNVANKFLRMGWDAVDQTFLRIAAVRSVSDFKQITTVSLTGAMQFLPVGPDGELKHGAVGEEVYTNQADTAGIIFSITRKDIRNDDLGALTATPRRIGRGGMLYLNHIGWTEFLNPSVANFFHTSNANVNTGVADMTVGGLAATEVIFMNQTDPDGKPLLAQPAILLVPTALKAAALTLMSSEKLIDGTATAAQGDGNIWRGRFRVESSPYLSNSAYTGYDAAAWYMLADPADLPVIEIAALDGNVMPTVETADAAFNVLGVQMRGYSDVGVKVQEPRGGVRADGGTS